MSRPSNVTAEMTAAGLHEKSGTDHVHPASEIMGLTKKATVEICFDIPIEPFTDLPASNANPKTFSAAGEPHIDDPFSILYLNEGTPAIAEGGVYRIDSAAEVSLDQDIAVVSSKDMNGNNWTRLRVNGPTVTPLEKSVDWLVTVDARYASRPALFTNSLFSPVTISKDNTTRFFETGGDLVGGMTASAGLNQTYENSSSNGFRSVENGSTVKLVYRFTIQKLL